MRGENNLLLLLTLRDNLMSAKLDLLSGRREEALSEIEAGLRLIEFASGVIMSNPRLSVFNFRALGGKQNSLVISDALVLSEALGLLREYAKVSVGRRKIVISFVNQENLAVKKIFLQLLAEKTNAKMLGKRSRFTLDFAPVAQAGLFT